MAKKQKAWVKAALAAAAGTVTTAVTTRKISVWNHPTTGEVRVYFSGFTSTNGSRGVKVFATQITDAAAGFDVKLTIAANGEQVNQREIEAEAGRVIDSNGGTFGGLLAASA